MSFCRLGCVRATCPHVGLCPIVCAAKANAYAKPNPTAKAKGAADSVVAGQSTIANAFKTVAVKDWGLEMALCVLACL